MYFVMYQNGTLIRLINERLLNQPQIAQLGCQHQPILLFLLVNLTCYDMSNLTKDSLLVLLHICFAQCQAYHGPHS